MSIVILNRYQDYRYSDSFLSYFNTVELDDSRRLFAVRISRKLIYVHLHTILEGFCAGQGSGINT
jgi:hypothetical protein